MTTKEIREKGYDSIDQFLQGLQDGKFSCFADFPIKDHGPFSQSFDFAKNLIDKHCLVGYKHNDHSNPGGIVYLTDEGMKVNDCGGIRQYLERNLVGTTRDEKNPSRLNDFKTALEGIRPSEDHSLYCIWHGFPLNGHGYNLGIPRSVVDKLVKSYLKGESELTISGHTYYIGSENFQIFKVPSQFVNAFAIENYVNTAHSGNISERLFGEAFESVTDQFLKDREWGELKEAFYNIHVAEQRNGTNILLLKKAEVAEFLKSFGHGLTTIWIAGETVELTAPKGIKIHEVSFEFLEKDRGTLLRKINLWKRQNNVNKDDPRVLNKFGNDVSAEFSIPRFGSSAQPESNAPSISEVKHDKFRIFISHSSKDADVVTRFVDYILDNSLGISSEQVFCTSIEGLGIRSGEDFRETIKEELLRSNMVIQLISKNYKASEICLNEMGAAWVLSKKVVPFVLDDNYDVGFIHGNSQQLKINIKKDLLQFVDDYHDLFPKKSPSAKIDRHVNEFIKSIS